MQVGGLSGCENLVCKREYLAGLRKCFLKQGIIDLLGESIRYGESKINGVRFGRGQWSRRPVASNAVLHYRNPPKFTKIHMTENLNLA